MKAELGRQFDAENENVKTETDAYDPEAPSEEIVEEDGIVYDYQNINGEVIKPDKVGNC